MSCVREGSLEPPYRPHAPADTPHTRHGEGRTGRFLRGLRRMFRRRGSAGARAPPASPHPKSRSTSELLHADKLDRNKEGAYSSGLSVSHDSVFTGERSGDESSDERNHPSIHHHPTSHRAELVAAVRRRGRGDGSDDDEDLGLPRSPPASPPTDKADKRHHAGISQSSCSDGSLLSVGSSEMDEDSSSGAQPHDHHDSYNSSEPPSGVAPLSHSAAKHKMAVRPRRTHGAPRRKKNNQIATSALPITPELNEEMIRSITPDVSHRTTENVTESYSSSVTTRHRVTAREHHLQLNKELQKVLDVTPEETKTKSSSLPPGLALSQLMGQSPAKLSIAENDTPRSSIKRSKSSSQGRSLRDDSPKPTTHVTSSESHIHSYHSEERIISRPEKYTEDSDEKKVKSDKKIIESESRSNKREESFFSRLLLRKSGKKSKKEQNEPDGHQENKKSMTEKVLTTQYKQVEAERSFGATHVHGQVHQRMSDQNKTAGQRAFANQMHKRLDNKGAYVEEGVYRDYTVSKVSGSDYNTNPKLAEDSNKHPEVKAKNRREEICSDKLDKPKRTSSKETVDEIFGQERIKRQTSKIQQPIDSYSSKAFINNELASLAREASAISPTLVASEDEVPLNAPRFRGLNNDYIFHSGSMPKSIPYFNHNMNVSASASPPKSIFHHSSENVKQFNRSSEHVSEYNRGRPNIDSVRRDNIQHNINFAVAKKDSPDSFGTGLRPLGEEYVGTRSSIGKSHSFRYASETSSLCSQENQMPSLPAIVGISEPLLESWEINYRRNVNHSHDYKRVSARNYNLLNTNPEVTYDSLPSTDSSYLDSLKTESQPEIERKPLYTNSILITETHKRDSDISQIEAKIDDIISSPKPIIGAMLKSSSLDSVQSTPEKVIDDRRKTVSVESALSQGAKMNNPVTQKSSSINKQDTENFISVTHLNTDATPMIEKSADTEPLKEIKTEVLAQKANSDNKTGVPEFMKIQLNKVDLKPATNVVLTANLTPKKFDSPPVRDNKEQNFTHNHEIKVIAHVPQQTQVRKSEPIQIPQKMLDSGSERNQNNDNIITGKVATTPIINRKSAASQSPLSTPKAFFKRKSVSVEFQDNIEKNRTNSLSTEGSTEKVFDNNMSIDQKSHSSFGSKTSIQSIDSNETKLDKHDEGVVFRKKSVMASKDRSDKKDDDEPELMKVFARRSLKLKDSEVESLAQEIAEATHLKDEAMDNVSATRAKILKNEFNASIKSRDSDKENEEIVFRGHSVENKYVDIAARVSQFGIPHYQRSVSISSVSSGASMPKRESAPAYNRSEVNKYKKEVSDSTPEKRLRNRTFPDPSNDREDIKNITAKTESLPYKTDTLSKRLWAQAKKEEDKKSLKNTSLDIREKTVERSDIAVIEKDGEMEKETNEKEKSSGEGEADASPQFKGILQMRAEWERRAMQGMTK